ncbi:MAG: dicarboxylate/amino acid:cation symporter [Calditrichales bacterium]|nr:MAG: dicarboxylate/amino acid:cation symporter [Calditrichales bacterium]
MKLYNRIFLGLALGILSGVLFREQVQVFLPVGKAFIQLIKMIVIPLVFASLLVGTAGMNDIKKLGKIGIRTLVFYLLSTAIAISIGLGLANLLKPGNDIPPEIQAALRSEYEQVVDSQITNAIERPSTTDLLLDIIPENPLRAMADGKMLQIIFFAIISGIAITFLADDKKKILLGFFEGVTEITIHMVHFVMRLAPYGVFALIGSVIGQYGTDIIQTLFSYFYTTIIALAVHVFIFNSLVIRFLTGMKITDFWRGIYPALLVAFSTSSSSATLPVSMECAEENLHTKPEVASFVLPLGATINMDGTAIFQGVSAIFIATVYGMDLTLGDQLTIIFTATLASIGTAGAPQVGVIMLTMVLQSIGIPLEGIALILGVERFLDMARTTVNVTSDLSCTAYISEKV